MGYAMDKHNQWKSKWSEEQFKKSFNKIFDELQFEEVPEIHDLDRDPIQNKFWEGVWQKQWDLVEKAPELRAKGKSGETGIGTKM